MSCGPISMVGAIYNNVAQFSVNLLLQKDGSPASAHVLAPA